LKTTWKAEISYRFTNATVADVKKLLGTILPGEEGYQEPESLQNCGLSYPNEL
jgi:hypothetical protein